MARAYLIFSYILIAFFLHFDCCISTDDVTGSMPDVDLLQQSTTLIPHTVIHDGQTMNDTLAFAMQPDATSSKLSEAESNISMGSSSPHPTYDDIAGAADDVMHDSPDMTTGIHGGVLMSAQDENSTVNSSMVAPEEMDEPTEAPQAAWSRIMDQSQIGITSIGFVANMMTFITLMRSGNRKEFKSTILFLLRHQTLIDALVCFAGCALLLLPPMWYVDIYIIDLLICHIWHGQQFYWGSVLTSIWSLVVIAFERFYAVCKPFNHQDFTVRRAVCILVLIYFLSIIFTSGSFFQVRMQDNGQCISEYIVKGKSFEIYMITFAISTWFTFFSIPTGFFVYLYGRVVLVFRRRQKESRMATSRIIDKATSELTKTAIVVTIIFIFSIGYDSTSYVFGNIGISEYKMGSPSQKIGVLLSIINSFANPFVYTLLLPVYRKQFVSTFFCCCSTGCEAGASNDTSSSSVASGSKATNQSSLSLSAI